MWAQRFALALALLAERGDATEAHLLLKARVMRTCARLRMADDSGEVLQNTWVAILDLMRDHVKAPIIARQTDSIIWNKAVDLIRGRERERKLALLEESLRAHEKVDALDDLNLEQELAVLMHRLREEHPDQYDAVALSLQSATHEEALAKWQERNSRKITPENFRQMHHRGTQSLRQYWESSNDKA